MPVIAAAPNVRHRKKKKGKNSLTSQILSGDVGEPKVDKNELLAYLFLLLLLPCVSVFFCFFFVFWQRRLQSPPPVLNAKPATRVKNLPLFKKQ